MRLTFPLALALLLPACGDNGGGSTSNTPTSNPSSTDPGTGSGSTAPTTGTASSTGDPVTTTGASATGSGTSSSTDPATGSTTTPVDPSSTGEPATGSTSDASSSSSSGSSEDTGATPGGDCVTDKDCALHNDCCDCFGIKAGDPDPICKKGCDKKTCDVLGIDQAVCRFGVCGTERVNCDASKILCDALPPQCPPGQVPGVSQNGSCWTGQCVPALSCNVVPDCSACPDDSMCVQKVAKPMSLPTCEPIPLDCEGKVDCKCAGTFVCTGNFNICNELGDNDLSCGCPQC